MADKRVVSVVADEPVSANHPEGFEVPEIDGVRFLNKKVETQSTDPFAKPAEEVKSLSGTSPVFKRRVTNQISKYRRGLEAESKVIHEDTFLTGYDAFDVIEPPYSLERLAKLYELSAHHYAAVNAKVSNIVGLGYKLSENAKTKRKFEEMADDEDKTAKTRRNLNRHRDDIAEVIEALNEEDTFTETLIKVWRDYEVMGNGYIEVGRKRDGTVGYVGHIPAQTLRIRRKRDGFVQISGFKTQFFANFGYSNDTNPLGGGKPNEVIHIKKYSPTSGYYGIPDIVAAMPAVVGNDLAGKFNLDYFENKAVPRHVIILKGAKLGTSAENALLSFFETSLKGQNHRSLYIPLPGDTPDNKVELKIEPVEAGVQDASFTNYRKSNLSDILMAHRVPVTKISVSDGASLAVARDADKTFKEQVCAPEQRIMEKKVGRIIKELTDAFDLKLNEMTLTDENTQSQIYERYRKTGVLTGNEVRIALGWPTMEGADELFDMNAAQKLAEMADATTRRGQDKQVEARRAATAGASGAGANANGNPTGTRQRDTTRSASRTDSAGEARNPKGEGRTTS